MPLKDNLLYLRYYLTNKKHTIKKSKKFTSVLVLTAAALLSLPVQAQTFTKKAAVDATHLKVQQKFTSKQLLEAKAAQGKAAERATMHDQTAVWPTPASTSGGDAKGGTSSSTSFAGKMPASAGVPSGMKLSAGRTLQTGAPRRAASVATAVDEQGVIREPGVHIIFFN